jgi:hypothetical protein
MNVTAALRNATTNYRMRESIRAESYADWCDLMRKANREGLSLDHIAEITGLSKSHVGRICASGHSE